MQSNKAVAIHLFLLLLPLAACGPQAISLTPPEPGARLDYDDALKDWTRSTRLYEDFESRVVARATYYSAAFVEAYVQEYDNLYRPVPAELKELRSGLEHRQVRSECFYLSFFTGNRDWNDLALSNSVWKVYLETSKGERLLARTIRQLDSKLVEQRHFFPYHDEFSESYLVCFDRFPADNPVTGLPRPVLTSDVQSFALSFRAPVGHFRLEWKLQ